MRQTVGRPVGDAGDHFPTVAVTHQDHVMQVFVVQDVDDVLHMGVQIDAGVCQMRAVTQTGQRRGKDGVSRCPELRHDEPVPRPSA